MIEQLPMMSHSYLPETLQDHSETVLQKEHSQVCKGNSSCS